MDEQDWDDNWEPMDDINRPVNHYFYLKVDPWTDYYYLVANFVTAPGDDFTGNQAFAYLNFSVEAL